MGSRGLEIGDMGDTDSGDMGDTGIGDMGT